VGRPVGPLAPGEPAVTPDPRADDPGHLLGQPQQRQGDRLGAPLEPAAQAVHQMSDKGVEVSLEQSG
jgi:hypothetical protein